MRSRKGQIESYWLSGGFGLKLSGDNAMMGTEVRRLMFGFPPFDAFPSFSTLILVLL